MQSYEKTLERAHQTLVLWKTYAPALTVAQQDAAALEQWIDEFEPLAQAQVLARYAVSASQYEAREILARLRELARRVPHLIEAQLDDTPELIAGLKPLYRIQPQTKESTLTRARELLPVWQTANAALAALPAPQPPITRRVQGVEHTAEMLAELLDGYNEQVRLVGLAQAELSRKGEDLRALARRVDRLNKQWYKVAANLFEKGTPEHGALEKVPVLPGARAPEPLELRPLKQGGEEGRQVLVRYAPKGGQRATRLRLRWGVEGVDEGLPHEAEADRAGHALGPFPAGAVVHAQAVSANSAATRLSAPRSIVIMEPPPTG